MTAVLTLTSGSLSQAARRRVAIPSTEVKSLAPVRTLSYCHHQCGRNATVPLQNGTSSFWTYDLLADRFNIILPSLPRSWPGSSQADVDAASRIPLQDYIHSAVLCHFASVECTAEKQGGDD